MKELELKALVPDLDASRRRIEASGGRLVFEGRLEDRRYDTEPRTLGKRDHVLRVRVYRDASGARAELDWKGPTEYENGYKMREELSAGVADA
ncbi:MAG TPA: CYTH domain-containing protein, partial [Gemmatimonadaceae bacterium]